MTIRLSLLALLAAAPAWAAPWGARPSGPILTQTETPVPASAPEPAAVPAIGEAGDHSPLFTPERWAALPAPDANALSWLAGRVPGLKTGVVRELDAAGIEAILSVAAGRGLAPMDLFTDGGLTGERIFLVREAALVRAFGAYEVPVVTLAEGQTTAGQPYRMQALLLGDGRVEMLYDRNDFRIKNPYFADHEYTLAGRVSHAVLGPGDMTVEGVIVEVGWVRPKLERFTKLSPTTLRVETSWGSRERPLRPIKRRAP